jgi:hypothetical protein
VGIGALNGGGVVGCGLLRILRTPSMSSLEARFKQVTVGERLIDLRRAPASVRRQLAAEWRIGEGADALDLPVARAYDLIYFAPSLSPACT